MLVILSLAIAVPAHADIYDGSYDYSLNFELDPRTGKYRPAYSYKTGRGDSTIWLDGANKNRKGSRAHLVKFTGPSGWATTRNEQRAQMRGRDGTAFTVFASRTGAATPGDFLAEWRSRMARYGAIGEQQIKRLDDAQLVAFAGAYAGAKGIALLVVVHQGGRALPVVIEFPDAAAVQRNEQTMHAFLKSIELLSGELGK
jgi:hypothetical protein